MFNVAGEGKLPWSEVASIGGAHLLPLPPLRPRLFAAPLRPARRRPLPARDGGLARYGRGVDTSRLREAGFEYRYTSAGAVRELRPGQQPAPGHRVGRARVPLRAGRRAVLPPLPRRGAGYRHLSGARAVAPVPLAERGPPGQASQSRRSSSARTAHSSDVMA